MARLRGDPKGRASAAVWAARLLMLTLSLSLSLAMVELALGLKYGEASSFRVRPAFDSAFLYTNRASTPLPPAPGTFRVLSYGDSVASGYGLSDKSKKYIDVVERSVNGGGAPFLEIRGMGRGHSPTQYAMHATLDLPEYQPHAIVVEIELSNDVGDESRARTRGTDAYGIPKELIGYRYALSWDGQLLAPVPAGLGWIERTKTYYGVSRWVGRQLGKVGLPAPVGPGADTYYYGLSSDRFLLSQESLDQGFDRMFESLAGMHRLARANDLPFLLMILPSSYAYAEESPYHPGALRLLERAHERASELGIPALGFLEHLGERGGSELFMDFCHLTAEGNRAVAERLEPALRSMLAREEAAPESQL